MSIAFVPATGALAALSLLRDGMLCRLQVAMSGIPDGVRAIAQMAYRVGQG